jgi:hypothetical protein
LRNTKINTYYLTIPRTPTVERNHSSSYSEKHSMNFKVSQSITASFLSAPAEVKTFEPRTGYYLLEVFLQDDHHTFKPLRITENQLAQIEILDRRSVELAENVEDFFFLIEAHRIRLAYQFDPQLTVSVSQVDPLPHQIETILDAIYDQVRAGVKTWDGLQRWIHGKVLPEDYLYP